MAEISAADVEQRITFKQLEQLLRDETVPESELRRYFTGDPTRSKPFAPVLTVDTTRVEIDDFDEARVQGAFAMNWANGLMRMRRQAAFERRRLFGDISPVLVAEGDSWFQFPIMLADIVDQLDASYLIWCVSAAGDTLATMVNEAPEYLAAVAGRTPPPKVLLFSGAGNDIVGEVDGVSVIEKILNRFEPGRPAAWYLETDAFEDRVAFIEKAYRKVFTDVEQTFAGRVAIVTHGYDRAIPWRGSGDPRRPSWAARDAWLAGPLGRLGVVDRDLQREIVGLMINRLNVMQKSLCGGTDRGGVFPHAYHVDLRGTLPEVGDWADELHPTDRGFAKVAAKFAPLIGRLVA